MSANEISIYDNTSLLLSESSYIISIQPKFGLQIDLKTTNSSQSVAFVYLKEGSGDITFNIEVASNSNLTILYWNYSDSDLTINETTTILKDAHYQVAYGELTKANIKKSAEYRLTKSGATVTACSAVITHSNKTFYQKATHEVASTNSNIENYGIVLKDAHYNLHVIGKIEKGASQSAAHQTTRVLTFDHKQNTKTLPELLIEENDVSASHAMTVGQMSSEQMYYLQSRGLSENEAMQLVTIGYLLPLTKLVDDESIKEKIVMMIEEKVRETCWM